MFSPEKTLFIFDSSFGNQLCLCSIAHFILKRSLRLCGCILFCFFSRARPPALLQLYYFVKKLNSRAARWAAEKCIRTSKATLTVAPASGLRANTSLGG